MFSNDLAVGRQLMLTVLPFTVSVSFGALSVSGPSVVNAPSLGCLDLDGLPTDRDRLLGRRKRDVLSAVIVMLFSAVSITMLFFPLASMISSVSFPVLIVEN